VNRARVTANKHLAKNPNICCLSRKEVKDLFYSRDTLHETCVPRISVAVSEL
jgi:hypothetical protein